MKRNRKFFLRIAVLLLACGIVFTLTPQSYGASSYTVKSTQTTQLAPGITQSIRTISYNDGTKSLNCFVATADINRGDVMVLNGYKDNNPVYNGCGTVTTDQQLIASNRVHQDPTDSRYIENYRVVAGCNGGFFNIPGTTGIPGFKGALVMEGIQYWEYDGRPFLAILKDGSAVVGSGTSDWNKYRQHMQEAIGGNVLLVKDGKNNTGNVNVDAAFGGQENDGLGTKRHPRTCVGLTQDGKVVMMVIDAQNTATASTRGGATLSEAAQMLIDVGCYYAINMDGGGSSTYMTMAEGATTPTLVNNPSGGSLRAICGSWIFASTAPTDHLSFEFDGTGAERYMTNLYSKRNYDLPAHWATGLSGTGSGDTAVSVNTATGLMTVNLTKRADSHSTYLALGGQNQTFDEATATGQVSLSYIPKNAEIFRIRLKLKDAKRYSSTDTPFVGLSYLSADTGNWSGSVIKATIPDNYLDGREKEDTFLTLTVDLTNHSIRNCSKLKNIMLQIGYLREGGAFIDQIYLGPKSGSTLSFDFSENPNKTSFYNDPAYNYQNFDREMYWYKGPEIASLDMNHGAMTFKVDNACTNLNEAYIETALSSKNSTHPLRYTPKAGDVIRIRYRVESYDSTLNASTYGASQKPTMTVYGFHDRQFIYKNPDPVTLIPWGKDYTVAQWTVPTEWTSYDISKLRITLRYFQNSTIKIDSIYVGPANQAATYDRMYIGFNDDAADRARYGSAIYGGMNMDQVGSWSVGSEFKPPVISGNVMKLTPNTGYNGYGYAHSGSQTGVYPLSFVPKADDYVQIRIKLENAVATDLYETKTGIGRFVLYYGNGTVGARENFLYHEFKVADVTDKGWVILTYPLKDAPISGTDPISLGEITSIAPCFNWVSSASGKTAGLYIDYIYIGPRGGLPNPMYTVTFKDGNGAVLTTHTVYKGGSVVYSGPSPKKDPDANYHYTFKGWDKSASNITVDTVITAQFTAVAHSYTYASVDGTNHKATCSCGYSKQLPHTLTYTSVDGNQHKIGCNICKYGVLQEHTWGNGVIVLAPTHTAEGKKSYTCTLCKATKTEPIEKLGDSLYFDFANTHADRERYSQALYGNVNFDLGTWSWSARTEKPVIDNATGTLSVTMVPDATNYSIYVQSSSSLQSNLNLQYDPKQAQFIQYRFKLENFKTDATPAVGLYYYQQATAPDGAGIRLATDSLYVLKTEDLTSGRYITVTQPVSQSFRQCANISAVRLDLKGIQSIGNTQLGKVTIDYIYVGPEATLPIQDFLFFDFTDTSSDQVRYGTKTYGGLAFDTDACWYPRKANTESVSIDTAAGTLTMRLLATLPNGEHYIQTSGSSSKGTTPLCYVPSQGDYFQMRVKIDGATLYDSTKDLQLGVYYHTGVNWFYQTAIYHKDVLNSGYFTVTIPLGSGFTAAEQITAIRPWFDNIANAEGKTATFTIDYISIGQAHFLKNAPCTVKFVDGSGKVLDTQTVGKGDTVYYRGATPTKSYDGNYHYSFRSWDKALTHISADTTFTATFTPTAHTYDYTSFGDHNNHQRTCQCGYTDRSEGHQYSFTLFSSAQHTRTCSKCGFVDQADHIFTYTSAGATQHTRYCKWCSYQDLVQHSYENGSCVCGEPEIKEPVLENSWKMNHTLNLAGDISVNLAVNQSLLSGFDMESVYVLAEVDTYEGNAKTGVKLFELRPVEQGNYYYFTLTGLTAVNMNDSIRSVLYGIKDGQPYYSSVDLYSIAAYAYSQLNSSGRPQTLKTLCAELLRYGAQAQSYKAYRTDSPVDSGMTPEQRAYLCDLQTVAFDSINAVREDLSDPTVKWVGKTLLLDSKVTVRYIVDLSAYRGSLADLRMMVRYTDLEGMEQTVTLTDPTAYNEAKSYYSFDFSAFRAAELRCALEAALYAGDARISATLDYSASTYGNNKTGTLGALCKALMAYSDSARAYFGK
ncbi:MAG: phosphodiester glycosidase family protein [Oscillospiraceae bacterium]|nr:phosphodiester glycosidase family protein [Oscillospiraceae bacterium]